MSEWIVWSQGFATATGLWIFGLFAYCAWRRAANEARTDTKPNPMADGYMSDMIRLREQQMYALYQKQKAAE